MNQKLANIINSNEFLDFYHNILLTTQLSQPAFIATNISMGLKQRLSADVLDYFLSKDCDRDVAFNKIKAETNLPDNMLEFFMKSYQPSKNNIKSVEDNLNEFARYYKKETGSNAASGIECIQELLAKLKQDLTRTIFTKSDNSEVLTHNEIDSEKLHQFRQTAIKFLDSVEPKQHQDEVINQINQENFEKSKEFINSCSDSDIKDLYDEYMKQYHKLESELPSSEHKEKFMEQIAPAVLVPLIINAHKQLWLSKNFNDELMYRKIKRNVNLNFDPYELDVVMFLSNLLESYKLGLIDNQQEVVFNGEYFLDRSTGSRITTSNQPITKDNIHTIDRNIQSNFIIGESSVYGYQENGHMANKLSFTLKQENLDSESYYHAFGQPNIYANKDGFFGEKECEFCKIVNKTSRDNHNMRCEYYLYNSTENDTGEKYVKVVERDLTSGLISIALYVFPLNHIGTGIQVARMENNPASFTEHNLAGKEKISTIFHVHKYNLLDQMRKGNGSFDIAIKLDDNLTQDECLKLFDRYCKTDGVPKKVYDTTATSVM